MTSRKTREPYQQYVYHFEFPMNSIDVRCITTEEKTLLLNLSKAQPETEDGFSTKGYYFYTKNNREIAKQVLTEHFPEEII